MGDFSGNGADLLLLAYDIDGQLLTSDVVPNSPDLGSFSTGFTLTVEDPGCKISYVDFYGSAGANAVNSILWDNFCFTGGSDNNPPVVSFQKISHCHYPQKLLSHSLLNDSFI